MKLRRVLAILVVISMLFAFLNVQVMAEGTVGEVILTEPFTYASYPTLLNTTTAEANWSTGWMANNTLTTALDNTYSVAAAGEVSRNNELTMYRGTSSITLNGEFDYFFKWDQSISNNINTTTSTGFAAQLIYGTNNITRIGMIALAVPNDTRKYKPYFMLQNGTNSNGNENIVLSTDTDYTIVARLNSRVATTTTKTVTGSMMAYEAGTVQPGDWHTINTSTNMTNWVYGALGLSGVTYHASGPLKAKALKVEKYTRAQIEPIDDSVNTAIADPTSENITAAQTQIATLIDGIAKDTFTAKINAIADQEDVTAAKNNLALTFASGDSESSVIQNIPLPTTGSNGTTVSWAASDSTTVTNTGVITRPFYGSGDKQVTLTATITKGSASDTKGFNITVKKYFANEDFSYEDGTLLSSTTSDYSNGWSSKWFKDKDLTTELAPSSQSPTVDYKAVNGEGVTSNYAWTMYRGLQNPIDMTKDVDYYISFDQTMNKTKSTSPSDRSRFELRNSSTTLDYYGFGMLDIDPSAGTDYRAHPNLQLYTTGGRKSSVVGDNTKVVRGQKYTTVIKISASSSTADSAFMKVFEAGTEELSDWELIPTSQSTGQVYTYIGFEGASYSGTVGANYDNIRIEGYERSGTYYANALSTINIAKATPTAENITSAQNAINLLPDGLAKNHMQAEINKLNKEIYVGIHNFTKTFNTSQTEDTIECTFDLTNINISSPNNATVIMALFNGDLLTKVQYSPVEDISVSAGANVNRTLAITVPNSADSGYYNYKLAVYVWDTVNGMKPHVSRYLYDLSRIE